MGDHDDSDEQLAPPWPAEGGRSFARGSWANIGPFNFRGKKSLRVMTKSAVALILLAMLATGVLLIVATVSDAGVQ